MSANHPAIPESSAALPLSERARFDAWYDAYEFRREYDKYGPVEAAWFTWQAARSIPDAEPAAIRAAALEEAARILVDSAEFLVAGKRTNQVDRHVSNVLERHAERIRALIGVSKEAGKRDTSEDAEIVAVYEKLHANKLGAHWLWVVIEQIAAGIPEGDAMREFGYYERRDTSGGARE